MKQSPPTSTIPFPTLKKGRKLLPHSLSLPTFPSLSLEFDASSTSSSSSSSPSSPTSPKRPSPLRQTSLPEGDLASSEPSGSEDSRQAMTDSLWFWRTVLSRNESLRFSRQKKTRSPVCSAESVDPPSLLDLPVWGTRGERLPSSSSTSPRRGSLPLIPSSPTRESPPREVRVKEGWELGVERRIRRYRVCLDGFL
ncbi:hypothetical protein BDY24DRAFT_378629 [Mrakia frigida]|uniref:uncharacterized protein n=1 Tax=Mrakia frigida TaxID=29902 RepID=UPI003FCC15E2